MSCLEDADKIFGPAQTAVARAVADAAEEGIIPEEKAEDLVVIVSVFIHPDAEDYRKIYQYNYSVPNSPSEGAMEGYPSIRKVITEKDREAIQSWDSAGSALWNPPYLQVALDLDSMEEMERIIVHSRNRGKDTLFEAGTPPG